MGKAADQALKDIAATRASLQSDLDALYDSIPDAATDMAGQMTGNLGPKVLGGVGALGAAVIAVKSMKSRSDAKKAVAAERQSARIRSEELARAFGSVSSPPAGGPIAPPSEPPADSGKGKLGLVLLLALAAGGAAAFLAGRR